MTTNVVALKNVEQQLNIAWSWRYKQLLVLLPEGEQCSAKAFSLSYVEHDLDLTDKYPEPKYLTWEQSIFDKEVQEYIQQFRAEKNKVANPVQNLLDDDLNYATASMAADQVEEYLVLRGEILAQHVGTGLGDQALTKVDALISLARLSFQRRAELMQFRHNETDRQKIKQHRSSISYFNRELTAIIRQIVSIQKYENREKPGNKVELL